MSAQKEHSAQPVVVFVGAFSPAARDGCVGGQLFACQTLVGSALQHFVRWILIDGTQRSQPPPSLVVRLYFVLRRLVLVIRATSSRTHCLLLFSSYALPSVLEKGVMCAIARARGIRVVWSIRSEVRPFGMLKTSVMRTLLRLADVLLCQTNGAAHSLRQILSIPNERVVCIPNWIDCASYPVKVTVPHVVTFLFLGWYEFEKGVRELIGAAAALVKEDVPFKLILAGGGSRRNWITKSVKELMLENCVSLNGWVSGETKSSLLCAADVLVLPSYTEGLPNAVLEGMASGLAIIASPVGGIPTVIEPGANGQFVPPGDVNALADAMKTFALDRKLVREIGTRNAAKVRDLHDISVALPVLADVFRVRGLSDLDPAWRGASKTG